jgi:two-component system NtrC family sensor kinase
MKILICIFLLALSADHCFPQTPTAPGFLLNNIPTGGVLLDQGWKFHAGDNAEWANPDFNDQQWHPINPTLELSYLPQVKQAGIGWFRLKLQVDSSLTDKMLAMVIETIGASEIYLNGKLIYRIGTVSKDYKTERTHQLFAHLISAKLAHQSSQILAVRYSFNTKNLYLKFVNIPKCMSIVVKDVNQAFTDNTRGEGTLSILRSIQLSFYLPLGVLILFLYYSFPKRKEYFYFGIFCLSMFASNLIHIVALLPSITSSQAMLFTLIEVSFDLLGLLSLINGTHTMYKLSKNWFFKAIALYALFAIPFIFIFKDWGGLCLLIFALIVVVEFLHSNFQAVRRHRPGAWILFTTAILLALTIIFLFALFLTGNIYLFFVVFSIAYVIPAIGLSLFTASDFARTGLALQLRVVEVEKLSEKTITQEKEKQQILAVQNETLETQVSKRTLELKLSLEELRVTQSQLIQSEKMASLGELTAGIAHEIQNPLNFVNNFSEVNKEMIAEMKAEINKGNYDEVKIIADDIESNEEKINHHGKRADAIVKGMLQHSQSSKGVKEPTDINALCDEYLRLSYHGLRAKDKSFNSEFKTDFDTSLGKINIVPQDIGRVLLNLINNAFYAVNERQKITKEGYQPTVLLSSKKMGEKLILTVKDNGNGIPKNIVNKIFQPFFTTKPTGQGTGLGLSLSYDIIKAHGGEIKVEANEGEGAEFIIILPI